MRRQISAFQHDDAHTILDCSCELRYMLRPRLIATMQYSHTMGIRCQSKNKRVGKHLNNNISRINDAYRALIGAIVGRAYRIIITRSATQLVEKCRRSLTANDLSMRMMLLPLSASVGFSPCKRRQKTTSCRQCHGFGLHEKLKMPMIASITVMDFRFDMQRPHAVVYDCRRHCAIFAAISAR